MIDQPPLGGKDLGEFLAKEPPPLIPLIEHFLYRQRTLLISADPKVGKSCLALQIAASLSSGTPVFGKLAVPAPATVYYLAFETLPDELREQAWAMRNLVPIATDTGRFWWDDKMVGLNLLRQDHLRNLIERIRPYAPELLIIDPLYMTLGGGLSKDEAASSYIQALRLMKEQLDCALLLIHHNHRERHSADGKVVLEQNRFYGSQWIRAFAHTTYDMKKRDREHTGTVLVKGDDRNKSCLPQITLSHDPQTKVSLMDEPAPDTYLADLVKYLEECRQRRTEQTDIYEALKAVRCSESHLRKLIQHDAVVRLVDFVQEPGKRTIWKLR